jgi:hypothetical protein
VKALLIGAARKFDGGGAVMVYHLALQPALRGTSFDRCVFTGGQTTSASTWRDASSRTTKIDSPNNTRRQIFDARQLRWFPDNLHFLTTLNSCNDEDCVKLSTHSEFFDVSTTHTLDFRWPLNATARFAE